MKRSKNIRNTDSYKSPMCLQYPEGTTQIFSYIESRGGIFPSTLFYGLQIYLKEFLSVPITQADIEEAEFIFKKHGTPFYRERWEYILKKYGGKLPVEIKAVPEGTLVPTKNVLVTITNTDPECYWLPTYLETALLRAVWYPTTVASTSYHIKQLIKGYLEKTGDVSGLPFKLHDFGARGATSEETAAIGASAHLATGFLGTDTFSGLIPPIDYYSADIAGCSIVASEHSTMTSWLPANEFNAYENMVEKFADNKIFACVSDSYSIYAACEMWNRLAPKIKEKGATVVIRPDSGDPVEVLSKCLPIVARGFGYEKNDKGYKVLSNVRFIWGDGINIDSIRDILESMTSQGWSADNFAFGMGGKLLTHYRDDLKWAMKCSAAKVNGEWRNVFKDPITDSGKKSKKGLLTLVKNSSNEYETVDMQMSWKSGEEVLRTVFLNGELVNETTFDEIRQLVDKN